MKRLLSSLLLILSIPLFGAGVFAAEPAQNGKTILLRTKTCILFELQEVPGRAGTPSTWVIKMVIAEPFPDSPVAVVVDTWLVGSTVSGVTLTQKGWHLSIQASGLAVTPRGSVTPFTPAVLANFLRAQLEVAFRQAVEKKTVPTGTVPPVVVADGLTSGTARVISAGRDATPITPLTDQQQALEDARADAEKARTTSKR